MKLDEQAVKALWADPDVRHVMEASFMRQAEIKNAIRYACEAFGYGAVMQAASEMWREKDPVGAIALGECYGTIAERQRVKFCGDCGCELGAEFGALEDHEQECEFFPL